MRHQRNDAVCECGTKEMAQPCPLYPARHLFGCAAVGPIHHRSRARRDVGRVRRAGASLWFCACAKVGRSRAQRDGTQVDCAGLGHLFGFVISLVCVRSGGDHDNRSVPEGRLGDAFWCVFPLTSPDPPTSSQTPASAYSCPPAAHQPSTGHPKSHPKATQKPPTTAYNRRQPLHRPGRWSVFWLRVRCSRP